MKQRVWIVEDDHDVLDNYRSILESDFEISSFSTPQECEEQALTEDSHVDALIIDYHFVSNMVTGLDLVDRIRFIFGYNVPVILISGHLSISEKILYSKQPFIFIKKPVGPEKFRNLSSLILKIIKLDKDIRAIISESD